MISYQHLAEYFRFIYCLTHSVFNLKSYLTMNSENFEKELRKTVNPVKNREALIGNGLLLNDRIQYLRKLKKKLYILEFLSDVTFVLGDQEEELKAHSFFLITASSVLHDLFTSLFNNDDDDYQLVIKISDISKPTMTEICRYAYSGKVRFNQHNMIDILNAATKLKMNYLMKVRSTISVEPRE